MLKLKNIYFGAWLAMVAALATHTHAVKLTSLHMGSLHLRRSQAHTHTESIEAKINARL